MKQASNTYNGKTLRYQEVFKSPFEKATKADALRVLEAIRDCHPSSSGWIEIEGYAEQLPNGNWRAVRNHAQYR
jgi:hypothetical protein